MKQFRILKRGNLYYPQWRYFFTWFFFYDYMSDHNTWTKINYNSEEAALHFINTVEYETIEVSKKKQSNSMFSLFSTGNITQSNKE